MLREPKAEFEPLYRTIQQTLEGEGWGDWVVCDSYATSGDADYAIAAWERAMARQGRHTAYIRMAVQEWDPDSEEWLGPEEDQ